MKNNKPSRFQNPAKAKKRLFYWLLVFFIGISLPVYFLLHKVYSQLENETWYRQRNQAELLVERIERELLENLQPEQDRPIADYSFFNVMENPLLQSITVNLSPLSELPPKSKLPGLLGYFQIDPDGSFHIPALPTLNMKQESYLQSGLSAEELAMRIELKEKLQDLLFLNEAVVGKEITNSNTEIAKDIKKHKNIAQKALVPISQFNDYFKSVRSEQKVFNKHIDNKNGAENEQTSFANNNKSQTLNETKPQQEKTGSSLWKLERNQNASMSNEQYKTNEDYRLRSRRELVKIPDQLSASEIFGRNRKSLDTEIVVSKGVETQQLQGNDNSPQTLPETELNPQVTERQRIPLNILSFESEVSPLQVIRLRGRNLCFFRSAWNGKKRYIQGIIVNELFLKGIVQPILDTTHGLPFISLIIANKGRVLQHFTKGTGDRELLLYHRAFLSPFQKMDLIVDSGSLLAGSSKPVLDLVSIALAVIITAGFILFYRLGAGQIELAKQQRNFISSVSHELKTPLTSIGMYSEMLRSSWVADESRKQSYYDYIFFESERLSRLISNVLQLARMDNQQDNVHLVAMSAEQLLQKIQTRIAAQIEASKFQLNVIPPKNGQTDVEVTIDEDAFFQIMINLVDNAIKFSKQSENNTIDIGYKIDARSKQVIFYVRDYGPGVEKEQMKKIFRLFYRAGDELTRTRPGTGIGLALVVQLADSMGVTVDLINRDPGVEFQVKCIVK